jgi:cytochrome c oxidase assembly factor CtaG
LAIRSNIKPSRLKPSLLPQTRLGASAIIGLAGAAAGAALALAPPMGALTHRSFAVHMVQHELFVFVIPPFLLLFARALPRARKAAQGRIFNTLSHPIPALSISAGVLGIWHLPRLYDAALKSEGVHILQHASLFLAFLLFWLPLVGTTPSALKTNLGRVSYIVAGAMPATALGAFLSSHGSVLYSYARVRDPLLPPLLDQQLGGAIMWFSGPIIVTVAAALVLRDPG